MFWNLRISPFYMTFAIHLFHNITFNQLRKKIRHHFFNIGTLFLRSCSDTKIRLAWDDEKKNQDTNNFLNSAKENNNSLLMLLGIL